MLVIGITFVLTLLLGVPIAYVLGLTTLAYIFTMSDMALFSSIPQRMFTSVQNYGLLAIPMFVFVGELMNSGGITNRLIQFAQVLLGHLKGGLAYVNVVANMFLASILGSANAQTAMMTKVMVPAMEQQGYKREFSTALTVSSSLMGPIIPPSLAFILYGVISETSITKMFLGGIIPGILFAIGFALLIWILSYKEDFPKSPRATILEILKRLAAVIPALLIPAIILVGILSGVFTATESSAIAALVAIIVGAVIYRELKWREIPDMLVRTALNSAIVTIMVAMASAFGWILALERIPDLIGQYLVSISSHPFIFLFLLNLLFLAVGMVMEGIAAMIILIPVLLPAAIQFGIDPVHFGIIICINLTIGLITPPVGTALFIASSISGVKLEKLSYSLIPFLAVALIVLALITYISPLTLWLPDVLMK